jgi:molecular chaperone Hsp33
VQRAHPNKPVHRSAVHVDGLDILEIFEQFFLHSEQGSARFLELDPTHFAMVLGLPEADDGWVRGLDQAGFRKLEEGASPLDEREFVLLCGCSPDKVAGTLARMFADQADEFFAGEPVVEALCPRCGARHLLDRKTFDRLVNEL